VTPTRTANHVYDVENRVVSASGTDSAFLVYGPLGRLVQVSSGGRRPTSMTLASGPGLSRARRQGQ
jgi:hypothetical protein